MRPFQILIRDRDAMIPPGIEIRPHSWDGTSTSTSGFEGIPNAKDAPKRNSGPAAYCEASSGSPTDPPPRVSLSVKRPRGDSCVSDEGSLEDSLAPLPPHHPPPRSASVPHFCGVEKCEPEGGRHGIDFGPASASGNASAAASRASSISSSGGDWVSVAAESMCLPGLAAAAARTGGAVKLEKLVSARPPPPGSLDARDCCPPPHWRSITTTASRTTG